MGKDRRASRGDEGDELGGDGGIRRVDEQLEEEDSGVEDDDVDEDEADAEMTAPS